MNEIQRGPARPSKSSALTRVGAAAGRFLPKYLYALFWTPFLFTAGALGARHRFLIFQIARHFGLKTRTGEDHLPVESLASIVGSAAGITLLEPVSTGGNVTLLELTVIASLAQKVKTSTAFEIGTFDGRTTLNIAANLPPDGKVFTLDLPRTKVGATRFALETKESGFVEKDASGTRFQGTRFASCITQLYGDSATYDFSPFYGQMGLIFIDGSHAYDYVRQDTLTALRLAAEGAIVLWHDYQPDWPGVIRALNEFSESNVALRNLRRIEGTSLVMLRPNRAASS